MIYKEDSTDILKAINNSLLFPVKIYSVTTVGADLYEIETVNMYHAQPGFPLVIGGKTYIIQDITPGTRPNCANAIKDRLIVKGSPAITAPGFDVYKPHFFHSTPIAQGIEMKGKNELDKVPMSWLYEQFTDTFYEDPESNKERTIRFRLFFLTHGSPEKWLTKDAYKNAIKPMRRLAENFIEKIKSMAWRFDVDTMQYDLINYSKFGVFLANKGMEKELWHDKVSGVELSMTLTVLKKDGCDNEES